jgi:N6-L-threonylcarbamoyladenine synthase
LVTVLAFETSCDETAVAILRDGNGQSGSELLASEVASQITEHEEYGGVVPEIASRNHLVFVPALLKRVLHTAKIEMLNVDVFAATSGPGLASSLMIGASIAKALAIGVGRPYLAINHLEGHVVSPFFGESKIHPNISLVASGGHTMSIFVRGIGHYEIIGRTVDDAAGEAFDKVAKLLGLGYPGGPEIEKQARDGDPDRFDLPRSMLDSNNFSFSGLKTAVRYLLPKLKGNYLADLCASFQQAIVDVLIRKTIAAAKKYGVDLVTVSGGVSCNQELRKQLHQACEREGFEFKRAEPWLCTDNAAMIAFAAMLRSQHGFQSSVTEEIDPNLALV